MFTHNGITFVQHRACDMLTIRSHMKLWFAKRDGKWTGDNFPSVAQAKEWADKQYQESRGE